MEYSQQQQLDRIVASLSKLDEGRISTVRSSEEMLDLLGLAPGLTRDECLSAMQQISSHADSLVQIPGFVKDPEKLNNNLLAIVERCRELDWDSTIVSTVSSELIERRFPYRMTAGQVLEFDPARDNTLAVAGFDLRVSPSDQPFRSLRQYIELCRRDTSIAIRDSTTAFVNIQDAINEIKSGVDLDSSAEELLNRVSQNVSNARSHINSAGPDTIINLLNKILTDGEVFWNVIQSVSFQADGSYRPHSNTEVAKILGIDINDDSQTSAEAVERSIVTLERLVEDLSYLGVNTSVLAKMNAVSASLSKLKGSKIEIADEARTSIFTKLREINERFSGINANGTPVNPGYGEFQEIQAFGYNPDYVGTDPGELKKQRYLRDLLFLNDPNIKKYIDDESLLTKLKEKITNTYNRIIDDSTGKPIWRKDYIQEEIRKNTHRVRSLNSIAAQHSISEYNERLDRRGLLENAKSIISAARWSTILLTSANAALLGVAIFGGASEVASIFGTGTFLSFVGPFALFSGLGIANFAVPSYLSRLALRRFMEIQDRSIGNLFTDLEQSVRNPKEIPPKVRQIVDEYLLYDAKIPMWHRRIILRFLAEVEPLFEHQVDPSDYQAVADANLVRDKAIARIKLLTLGFKHDGLRGTGERGLEPEDIELLGGLSSIQKWLDENLGFDSQDAGNELNLKQMIYSPAASHNHQKRLRSYYFPPSLSLWFPDRRGYCENEDVFRVIEGYLKIKKHASVEHSQQDPLQLQSLLNTMKSEIKELSNNYRGYDRTGKDSKVVSVPERRLLAESPFVYYSSSFLGFVSKLFSKE